MDQRVLGYLIAVSSTITLSFFVGQNAILMVLTFWLLQWRAARNRRSE